jgi:hypothetical protein
LTKKQTEVICLQTRLNGLNGLPIYGSFFAGSAILFGHFLLHNRTGTGVIQPNLVLSPKGKLPLEWRNPIQRGEEGGGVQPAPHLAGPCGLHGLHAQVDLQQRVGNPLILEAFSVSRKKTDTAMCYAGNY